MQIFIIPTSYPDREHPTKNIFIYEQAKALAAKDNDITVLNVVKHPSTELFKTLPKGIQIYDDGFAMRYAIHCHTFKEDKYSKLNGNHFTKKMMKLIEYVCKKEGRPDIIYAHFSLHAGYAAIKIKEKYGIPVMVLEHYSEFMTQSLSNYKIQTLQYVVKNADIFATVSEGLRDNIIKYICNDSEDRHCKSKIEIVYNMVDPAFQYTEPSKNQNFTFFALGRLAPQKKYDVLIRAFCLAFAQNESVMLKIAGAGELKNDIEKLISENGREKQIILLGNLARDEIVQQYKLCDCFSLASGWETFGIVWREAMAVGRPIITTDHGGFHHWKDTWGIKVAVDNEKDFADAMKKMVVNYHLYNSEMISKECLSMYSSDVIADKIIYLMKRAVNIETKEEGEE